MLWKPKSKIVRNYKEPLAIGEDPSLTWFNVDLGTIMGFSYLIPNLADEFYSEMASGKIGIFKPLEIRVCNNPSNQYFGTLKFDRYKE